MNICIFGAGAIGSLLGGKLAITGKHKVTLVARGKHLHALQKNGLTLTSNNGKTKHIKVYATNNPQGLPKQDIIIVTTKSHSLEAATDDISSLLHSKTIIIYAMNGIPWWYFHAHGGKWDNHPLESLDSNNKIWQTLSPERTIGCVIYYAANIHKAGHVHYIDNELSGIKIGEPSNIITERLQKLESIFNTANCHATVTDNIRTEIWYKLWCNIAINPVTALTHATMDIVVKNYHDTDLIEAIMNEARFVAEKIGIIFRDNPLELIHKASSMKGHKTSMLQDIEAGRKTEIESIVGAVREIGQITNAPTPHLDALYTLVRMKEQFYRHTFKET